MAKKCNIFIGHFLLNKDGVQCISKSGVCFYNLDDENLELLKKS